MRRPQLAAIAALSLALATIVAAPATSAAPLPSTSSSAATPAKPTPSPSFCLSSNSTLYAYIIANHTDGKRYVNRGKCSQKLPRLISFTLPREFNCTDALRHGYFGGYTYDMSLYSGVTLNCFRAN